MLPSTSWERHRTPYSFIQSIQFYILTLFKFLIILSIITICLQQSVVNCTNLNQLQDASGNRQFCRTEMLSTWMGESCYKILESLNTIQGKQPIRLVLVNHLKHSLPPPPKKWKPKCENLQSWFYFVMLMWEEEKQIFSGQLVQYISIVTTYTYWDGNSFQSFGFWKPNILYLETDSRL